MATKIVTKNSSTASAVPTASDLVQGELAVNVADKRLFTEDNAGAIVELGTNPSGNVTFQDNGKAIFGAGDDLQVYHDGSNSYVKDVGTGTLNLQGSTQVLIAGANGTVGVQFIEGAGVNLRHNNSQKLATTSSGIDVTGTATMDGLSVDGNAVVASTVPRLILSETDVTNGNWDFRGSFGNLLIRSLNDDLSTASNKLGVGANGDISFYEDTGTTPKFFWDASAESLGLGVSNINARLEVAAFATTSSDIAHFSNSNGSMKAVIRLDAQGDGEFAIKDAANNEDVVITAGGNSYFNGGNVGIGTTSPSEKLQVEGTVSATGMKIGANGTDINSTFLGASSLMTFKCNGTERMRIDSSGTLLLRHSSETNNVALSVGGGSGVARVIPAVDNQGYIGQVNRRWQAIYAVAGSIDTSDEREKTEIKPTTLGLDFIKDLKPVSYKWIDAEQQNKGKDKREHQGLIAQQVAETVEKHGIDKNSFGGLDIQKTDKYNDFHGMTYSQLIAPIIKAIQEQQTLIESLTARIAALEE